MANVTDVARYILEKLGPISAMKLQKLVYYGQSWHLVWDEQPLFQSTIKAWSNGPVVPDLWKHHKGMFTVRASDIPGDAKALTDGEQSTIDAVLSHYGDKSAQYLIELTHGEPPWQRARRTAAGGTEQPGDPPRRDRRLLQRPQQVGSLARAEAGVGEEAGLAEREAVGFRREEARYDRA